VRFRLKAFGFHLLGSACALSLILGGLYFGWYRWPGWYLTGVLRVLLIVGTVDLALGPFLTFIVANPHKPRRALARDIAVIAAVQVIALSYGAMTLWHGRPLYYTFSLDLLEMVQASDIPAEEARRARQENPALAPFWFSRPRWVWAPLPADAAELAKIAGSAVFGGPDVVDMPRYFRPWDAATAELRGKLAPVTDNRYLSRSEKQSLAAAMARASLPTDERNTMLLWSHGKHLLAVFDPATLAVRAILNPGPR
jgi:hypothetical protein